MEAYIIATLALINFIHIVDFMMMMPLGPVLMGAFSCNAQEFSWLVSSFTFAGAAAGFLGPLVIDRFDRKVLLRFFFAGITLSTFACGLASNYKTLLLARTLAGVMGGFTSAMIFTIIAEVIPESRRGRAMGQLMLSLALAATFGVPIGLFLADRWGWHAPFFILSGLSVLIQVMIERYIPSLREHLQHQVGEAVWKNYQKVMADLIHRQALLFALFFYTAHFMIIPFISVYLVANAKLPQGELFWIYLTGGMANTLASPWIGKLVDRRGAKRLFVIFSFLAAIPVWWATHLRPAPLMVIIACGLSLFLIYNGRIIPAMTLINLSAKKEQRGAFLALLTTTQSTAAGLGTWIGGLIVTTNANGELLNYSRLGHISIVLSWLAIALALRVGQRETRPKAPIDSGPLFAPNESRP